MAAMQEDFFADTAMIGIASALPAYRFCWLLNNHFDINFVREPDMDVSLQVSADTQHHFPLYKFCRQASGASHSLYRLKSGKESLLPEAKQLDYLWLVQSNTPEADVQIYTRLLRDIPDVQLAQILATERLKNLNNLII